MNSEAAKRNELLTALEAVVTDVLAERRSMEDMVHEAVRRTLSILDSEHYGVLWDSEDCHFVFEGLEKWFGKPRRSSIPVSIHVSAVENSSLLISEEARNWILGSDPKLATMVIGGHGDDIPAGMAMVCLNDRAWVPISWINNALELLESELFEVLDSEQFKEIMSKQMKLVSSGKAADHDHIKARFSDSGKEVYFKGVSEHTKSLFASEEVNICKVIKCGDMVLAYANHDQWVPIEFLEDEYGLPLEADDVDEIEEDFTKHIVGNNYMREVHRLVNEICPGDLSLSVTDFGLLLSHAYKKDKYVIVISGEEKNHATIVAKKGYSSKTVEVTDNSRFLKETLIKVAEIAKEKW